MWGARTGLAEQAIATQATVGWRGSTLRVGCWLAAALTLGALIAGTDDWPAAVPLVLFALLHILAENSSADLPTTTVSPSFMVVMAAIASFDGEGVTVGAALIGLGGGLVIANFRRRRFAVVASN